MKAKLLGLMAFGLAVLGGLAAYFKEKAEKMQVKANVARDNHAAIKRVSDITQSEAENYANKPKDKPDLIDRLRRNGL